MASLAHRMALAFEQITADVIEANEFPRLSQAYNVMNVPKTVVNDRIEIVGAVPERLLRTRRLQCHRGGLGQANLDFGR